MAKNSFSVSKLHPTLFLLSNGYIAEMYVTRAGVEAIRSLRVRGVG